MWLVLTILLGLAGVLTGDRSIENVALLLIFQYVSILPHELGHVIGAWVAHMEVIKITYGRGRVLWDYRVGGTLLEFRRLPVVGSVVSSSPDLRQWRVRRLMMVAGGPIANIVMIALSIELAGGWKAVVATNSSRRLSPLLMLAGANLFLLMGALFGSSKVRLNHRNAEPDGQQLKRMFWGPPPSIQARRLHFISALAERLETAADHAYLEQRLYECQEELPQPVFDSWMSVAASGSGVYQRSNDLLIAQLGKHQELSQRRAHILNTLAWNHLLLGKRDAFAEADRASAEAYALLPWSYGVLSTRGWALAEIGRTSEGLPMLRQSLKGPLSRKQCATVLCTMAIAEARRQDPARARGYLARAARTDRNCELLARAATDIAFCATPASEPPATEYPQRSTPGSR